MLGNNLEADFVDEATADGESGVVDSLVVAWQMAKLFHALGHARIDDTRRALPEKAPSRADALVEAVLVHVLIGPPAHRAVFLCKSGTRARLRRRGDIGTECIGKILQTNQQEQSKGGDEMVMTAECGSSHIHTKARAVKATHT